MFRLAGNAQVAVKAPVAAATAARSAVAATATIATRSHGLTAVPYPQNEPMLNYAPGSAERANLKASLSALEAEAPFDVPIVIGGERVSTTQVLDQAMPHDHANALCKYSWGGAGEIASAIEAAQAAKASWEATPFEERAAIFLKAADLVATKYRGDLMAATMLGQGKNAWQAEIDAAAELADFLRFNCHYAEELYRQVPQHHSPTCWNRMSYRPLEGFVFAISPFNFTAIGGNLPSSPALMGNTVVWKPSDGCILSNYLVMQIFEEAGLPPGVINFVPFDGPSLGNEVLTHRDLGGVHFTGSTAVFRHILSTVGNNISNYRGYPRLVGETGGKNFHFVHPSADVETVINQTVRTAFEYQGQKCSAGSLLYIPTEMWENAVAPGIEAAISEIKVGPCTDFTNFMGPVINQAAYDRITGIIEDARDGTEGSGTGRLVMGGDHSDEKGWFVGPSVIKATTADLPTQKEIFGPVLSVITYDDVDEALAVAAEHSEYALTGAIFGRGRDEIQHMARALRNAAGNFYINDKSTGAVVGQQPFGGARGSGTNDKAGSFLNLIRWTSPQAVKETFVPLTSWKYPSMDEE